MRLNTARSHKAGRVVAAVQKPEPEEHRSESTKMWRKYNVQVIVSDPEGEHVFNLTRLVFKGDMYTNGHEIQDIQEALQLLVEAAAEWSA